ncbi:MAG: hypothetical protein C4304_03715 [candidate division GAL15 bacterium]
MDPLLLPVLNVAPLGLTPSGSNPVFPSGSSTAHQIRERYGPPVFPSGSNHRNPLDKWENQGLPVVRLLSLG